MITHAQAQQPDGYETFFGFSDRPFSLSANPRFRFPSVAHENALTQVMYGVQRREPVIVVTGDIGLGKTLLCRTVLEWLPRKTFLSVIDDPLLSSDDLLKRILEDFGVISTDGAGSIHVSRHELAHAMHTFLVSLASLDAHAVVIIDEAQHLQIEVLEQVRLLANVEDSRGALLQIVLVGQSSLQVLLDSPELQQLRQRITRYISLSALTNDEVKQYIDHRLTVAREADSESRIPGAPDLARAIAAWNESSRPVTFTQDAIDAAARVSHGVPRLVNVVCDRALEVAFSQQSRTIDAMTVDTAARLVQLQDTSPVTSAAVEGHEVRRGSGRYVAAAIIAIVVVGAVAWFGMPASSPARDVERRAVQTPAAPIQNPSAIVPAAAAPVPASTEPNAVTPPPVASAAPSAPADAAQTDDAFEIIVASFRTEGKAAEVTGQLADLGQPVHQRSISGWRQVVAGPFVSRTTAEDAQRQLDRNGFAGSHIVRASQ